MSLHVKDEIRFTTQARHHNLHVGVAMTAIEPIETASSLSPAQQALLLFAVAFVAVMVIGVCLVIGVGTASRPVVANAPKVSAPCRLALDRARAVDRNGSSAEAITAAKHMLRVCRA